MLRVFRITNTTRHCGLPTKAACIVLGVITTAMEIFCLLFLPVVPAWILVGLSLVALLLLIIGAMKLMAALLIVYMILNILIRIPIFVVIYYISYTLAGYDSGNYLCSGFPLFRNDNDYQCSLYEMSEGLLWAGLVICFVVCIFEGLLLAGLRKLRCLCMGITTVSYARRDCHPRAVVVTSPQQVVYTTTAPAATVYQPYPSNMTAQPAPAQYGYPPGPSAYQPQPGYAYQPPQNPNAPPNPSVVLPPPEYKE
ncbi:hypothetical protein Q1695_002920 [Nippostrongylus brasiliensis]|nr:hypothetical protein Q1695_002920 [Nippostrongylus brasiliensis]